MIAGRSRCETKSLSRATDPREKRREAAEDVCAMARRTPRATFSEIGNSSVDLRVSISETIAGNFFERGAKDRACTVSATLPPAHGRLLRKGASQGLLERLDLPRRSRGAKEAVAPPTRKAYVGRQRAKNTLTGQFYELCWANYNYIDLLHPHPPFRGAGVSPANFPTLGHDSKNARKGRRRPHDHRPLFFLFYRCNI